MRTETTRDYHAAITRAVAAAFANLDRAPSAAALAEAAGFSAFHFSRMFAGMVGESPGEFVRRLRLERAAHRLRQPGARVTETAFDAGYESLEAFTRAFRAAFLCTPSAFRARRLSWELPTPNGLHFQPDGCVPTFIPRLTGGIPMEVEIRENVPARRLAAIRHIGPYWQIGAAFGRLTQSLCAQEAMQEGPGVAVYYDDPETTPEADLRSDACALMPAGFVPADPQIAMLDLPGGRFAVYTHVGHYSGLGAAWGQFMGQWLPSSGHAIDETRPCFEVYLNDCTKVAADALRTELYQPIS